MTNLSRHPVLRAIYGASQAIEKCGASRELTDAVMAVTALYAPAEGLLDRIASLERQLEDARKQPLRYVDGPEDGADPRCLVTLEEDGMRWVGIRAWNANTGQWLNGGEPERARVMAWQPLPVPASGYWQHGKLVNTERT